MRCSRKGKQKYTRFRYSVSIPCPPRVAPVTGSTLELTKSVPYTYASQVNVLIVDLQHESGIWTNRNLTPVID